MKKAMRSVFFGGIPKGGRATQTDHIKFLSESLSCESGQRNTKYICEIKNAIMEAMLARLLESIRTMTSLRMVKMSWV